jgi:ClpP class serine protease
MIDSKQKRSAMKSLLGKKYALANGAGVDCFSIIYNYAKLCDYHHLPVNFEGLTMDSYGDLYLENPEKAVEIMRKYMDETYDKVLDSVPKYGDILLVKLRKRGHPFLGIYAGSGNLFSALTTKGTAVCKLSDYSIISKYRFKG